MQRQTRQRQIIEQVLKDAGRPLLPTEVLALAQRELPQLGIATVFRALKDLAESGTARAVQLPGSGMRYERGDTGHHHHFQCRQCTRVFDIHACPGEFDHQLPQGFSVDDHEVTLYGRCADCTNDAPGVQLNSSKPV